MRHRTDQILSNGRAEMARDEGVDRRTLNDARRGVGGRQHSDMMALVLQALAQALVNLESAGFAPETALGDMQFLPRGTELYPFPGGPDLEGVIQIATYSGGASATQ